MDTATGVTVSQPVLCSLESGLVRLPYSYWSSVMANALGHIFIGIWSLIRELKIRKSYFRNFIWCISDFNKGFILDYLSNPLVRWAMKSLRFWSYIDLAFYWLEFVGLVCLGRNLLNISFFFFKMCKCYHYHRDIVRIRWQNICKVFSL